MTQLQILAIAGPLWAAALVGVVVVVGNYRDNLAMKREHSGKAVMQENGSETDGIANNLNDAKFDEILRVMAVMNQRLSVSSKEVGFQTELQRMEAALAATSEPMAVSPFSASPLTVSPLILNDPGFAIGKISEDIHNKIELMASLAKVNASRS